MADSGVHGAGSTLKYSIGTATAATAALAQITNIGLPAISVDDIDISTMDSVEKWRSFIPGMKDGGDLPMDCMFEKVNASTIMSIVGVPATWQIQVNDAVAPTSGTKFNFSGYLKSMGGAIPFNDKVTQTLTIKVSGKPLIA